MIIKGKVFAVNRHFSSIDGINKLSLSLNTGCHRPKSLRKSNGFTSGFTYRRFCPELVNNQLQRVCFEALDCHRKEATVLLIT